MGEKMTPPYIAALGTCAYIEVVLNEGDMSMVRGKNKAIMFLMVRQTILEQTEFSCDPWNWKRSFVDCDIFTQSIVLFV